MKKGSGINWHDDTNVKYGATLYLNNRWSSKWGGEFMFKDENSHGWIPPTPNSLILIKSPVIHKVNTIIGTKIPRISIQMFMR
jgi:Rps23 Pro-64 3,4-dihydroxylase Tpa1-like proline 4-hydroxylase